MYCFYSLFFCWRLCCCFFSLCRVVYVITCGFLFVPSYCAHQVHGESRPSKVSRYYRIIGRGGPISSKNEVSILIAQHHYFFFQAKCQSSKNRSLSGYKHVLYFWARQQHREGGKGNFTTSKLFSKHYQFKDGKRLRIASLVTRHMAHVLKYLFILLCTVGSAYFLCSKP